MEPECIAYETLCQNDIKCCGRRGFGGGQRIAVPGPAF